ncbi:MAG: hypothetical protein IPH75_02565 [bacterium]|nr:hypothetical protein [bacterium]
MSRVIALALNSLGSPLKLQVYFRIGAMLVTTMLVCSTLIFYFGNQMVDTLAAGVATLADIAVASILPYLFAAAIAGMTAMAITTILPTARSIEPQEAILHRLRQLSSGDLTTSEKVASSGPMREISMELNQSIGMLRHQMTAMKIVNRQQWSTLCNIRDAVERGNLDMAMSYIEQMEKTWQKTAEIEKKLLT